MGMRAADGLAADGPLGDGSGAGAVFVAEGGSDAADGSAGHPFATFARARSALREGGGRTLYVRAGRYRQTFALGAEDSGLRVLAFPGERPVIEGSGTLVALDGASDVTVTGLAFEGFAGDAPALSLRGGARDRVLCNHFLRTGTGLLLDGTADAVVAGNTFLDTAMSAVEAKDGADRALLYGNRVNGTGATDTNGGGFFLHGVSSALVARNLVENTAGSGIGILNWDEASLNFNNTVACNVVRRTNLIATDSGAIYTLGRSQRDTGLLIDRNLVDGARSAIPDPHVVGIYLDDQASGVTVSNNVVRGAQTHAVQVHGGHANRVVGNLFDLSRTKSGILFQASPADQGDVAPMTGNEVSGNTFYAAAGSPAAFEYIEGGVPSVSGNLFRGASANLPALPKDGPPGQDGEAAAGRQAAGKEAMPANRLCGDAAWRLASPAP